MATRNGGASSWAVPLLAAAATACVLIALAPGLAPGFEPWARPAAFVAAAILGVGAAVLATTAASAGRRRSAAEPQADAVRTELAQAHDRAVLLEHVLDVVAEGLVLMGAGGELRMANRAARGILSLGPRASSPTVEALGLGALAEQAVATGQTVRLEREIHFPARRLLSVQVRPFQDGAVVLLDDVTAAHHADEVRRDFVSNVSHELKTPVSGIALLAEQLSHAVREDPAAAHRFAERINREAERLGRMVVDLLDLTRVESGLPLRTVRVEAVSLAREAIERVAALAEAKQVRVDVDAGDRAVSFDADEAMVTAALANLLDNAVRYSPERSVVGLSIRATADALSFAVEDHGQGIPTEELGRVFERFYRVDKARARSTGGTGLGLSIVKHVAERHGGSVAATSELGRGSRFVLTLPLASASASASAPASAPAPGSVPTEGGRS